MEPMIIAILVIGVIFLIGGFTVYRIYKNRTQTPSIDVNKIIPLPEMPDGVSLSDITGELGKYK